MTETVLKIGDLVFPVGSARGITQSLTVINNGDLRRTVNGVLVDVTRAANRKFESTVNCADRDSPSIAGVWRGQEFLVECIANINQAVAPASDTVTLIRDAVASSIYGQTLTGTKILASSFNPGTYVATFSEDVVNVKFRPILSMRVVEISLDDDEYAAEVGWSLGLEEI